MARLLFLLLCFLITTTQYVCGQVSPEVLAWMKKPAGVPPRLKPWMEKDAGKWIRIDGTTKTWLVSKSGEKSEFESVIFITLFQLNKNHSLLVQSHDNLKKLTPYLPNDKQRSQGIAYNGRHWLLRLENAKTDNSPTVTINYAKVGPRDFLEYNRTFGIVADWTKIIGISDKSLLDNLTNDKGHFKYELTESASGEIVIKCFNPSNSFTVTGIDSNGTFVPRKVEISPIMYSRDALQAERYIYKTGPLTEASTTPQLITREFIYNDKPSSYCEITLNSVSVVKDEDAEKQLHDFYRLPQGWQLLDTSKHGDPSKVERPEGLDVFDPAAVPPNAPKAG